MKKILFTGGGGAGNEALWNNLKDKYNIYFADADINRINPNIPKNNIFQIPFASSKSFINKILKITKDLKIDYVIPGVDEELLFFAEKVKLFAPTIIVIPKINFIKTMGDKYQMVKQLKNDKIKVPRTILMSENYERFSYPCISKPRNGRGSRLVFEHLNPQSVKLYINSLNNVNLDDFILQEKIVGSEYTVQVIVDIKNNIKAIVPINVKLKNGITISAITEKNDGIRNLCHKIHNSMPSSGIYNVQLIVNQTGEPVPFEINTRISTTFCLALNALKYDPFEMLYLNIEFPNSSNFVPGLHLERYWHNYFFNSKN